MNRDGIVILILIILLFGGVFLLKNLRKNHSWNIELNMDREEPYDVKLFIDVLTKTKRNTETIVLNGKRSAINQFNNYSGSDASLVYIGNDFYTNSNSIDSLKEFVTKGNHAIIICEEWNESLFYILLDQSYTTSSTDFSGYHFADTLNIIGKNRFQNQDSFACFYQTNTKASSYSYSHFIKYTQYFFWDNDFEILHTDNETGDILGFRIKLGEGYITFHSVPLVFTNFHFSNKACFNIVEPLVLENKLETVFLDNYGSFYNEEIVPHKVESQNPLRFLYSQRPLRHAWYIVLIGLALLMLFGSKRKQRAIALSYERKNHSVNFAQMVAKIHELNMNNYELAMIRIKSFEHFLNQKYGFNLSRFEDDANYVANKTGVNENIIRKILSLRKKIKDSEQISDHQFLDLSRELNIFYGINKNSNK